MKLDLRINSLLYIIKNIYRINVRNQHFILKNNVLQLIIQNIMNANFYFKKVSFNCDDLGFLLKLIYT